MFSSQSGPANSTSNPFAQQPSNPFAAATAPKNVFSQGSSGWQPPKENPFAKKSNPFTSTEKPASSPFAPKAQPAKPFHNPFAPTNGTPLKNVTQPSASATPPSTNGSINGSQSNPFAKVSPSTTNRTNTPNGPAVAPTSYAQDWDHHKHGYVQPAWVASKETKPLPKAKLAPGINGTAPNGKRKSDQGRQDNPKFPKSSAQKKALNSATPTSLKPNRGEHTKPIHTPRPPKRPALKNNAYGDDVGTRIRKQLAEDGLKPPQWPPNPGSASQRKAVEKFREAYSAYREKAMKSLISAGLFDDPDKKRRLSEAINFKGICEDMCPDWDKVTRIVQHDIKKEEKEEVNGELVASLPLMVTRYSRSSAGQDLPLPMDVRSPTALRRTLDYLISELIAEDDYLPIRHHFLWDRTRAIRREFTFQGAAMCAEEKKDYLYCLETITRFHVTSLHLLSQPDFGHEGFSEQQEIEQLSKTLISLMEAYDDFSKDGITCENEAEFRGYYVVFNAGDSALMEKVQSWDHKLLQTDHIRTAMCLAQALQNTWTETGPLIPKAGTEMALNMASMFFSIVASPQISYTMACFAEVHFGSARHSMLQTILNGYQRPKGGPKDLTPTFLKERLHFETEEDAIAFAELHQLDFRDDGNGMQLVLPPSTQQRRVPKIRVPHSYSYTIVERKRGDRSLPDVIYQTVWDEGQSQKEEESLFVDDSENTYIEEDSAVEAESDVETVGTTRTPPATLGTGTPPSSNSASFFSNHPSSSPHVQSGLSTEGVSVHDFGSPRPPNATGASSSLFKKPPEGLFGQGLAGKNPQTSTSLFPTTSEGKAATQPDPAPQATKSTSLFSQETSASSTPPPTKSSTFNQAQTNSSATNNAPPASVFSSVASASGPGIQFPLSAVANDSPKQASTAASGITAGDRMPKPKKHVTFDIGETSTPDGQTSTVTEVKPFPPSSSSPSAPPMFQPPPKPSEPLKQLPRELGSLQHKPIEVAPPKPAEKPSPAEKPNPMDSFTRWVVCGDKGLMETHLEPLLVENLLKDIWDEYHQAEEERRRREEEEKSWAEARNYRAYSLSVKYFYKWRDGSRKRRRVKRIQAEREKARQWRLPENVAKREAEAKAAQDRVVEEATNLLHRRSRRSAEDSQRLRQSTQSQPRRQSREHSIENALLASGVLDGVHDPREAARYAARDAKTDSDHDMLPGEQMLLRAKNQRRMKQGLQPLKQIPQPKTYKEGSKSAMLKALSSGTGRDSLSMSTSSFRNSTFSSSYRSSLGFNSSRVSKARPKVTDPYWRLKASGLVQMPNGEYLHESLAIPMLQEGKRFPGLGDYGIPREHSTSPSQTPSPGGTNLLAYSPTNSLRHSRISNSPAASDIIHSRKRIRADDEGEDADDDLASLLGASVTGDRKRAKSGSGHDIDAATDDTDLLSSIDNLLLQVQEANRASSQA